MAGTFFAQVDAKDYGEAAQAKRVREFHERNAIEQAKIRSAPGYVEIAICIASRRGRHSASARLT